jgi:hypothetical protein
MLPAMIKFTSLQFDFFISKTNTGFLWESNEVILFKAVEKHHTSIKCYLSNSHWEIFVEQEDCKECAWGYNDHPLVHLSIH